VPGLMHSTGHTSIHHCTGYSMLVMKIWYLLTEHRLILIKPPSKLPIMLGQDWEVNGVIRYEFADL
jgi:hypothetical protein